MRASENYKLMKYFNLYSNSYLSAYGVYPRPNNVLNLHLSLIGKQWKFKIFEGVIKKCLKLSCAGSSLQALFYY